jgi:hypothetical protein
VVGEAHHGDWGHVALLAAGGGAGIRTIEVEHLSGGVLSCLSLHFFDLLLLLKQIDLG